jgi:hypothetical protein
MHGIDDARLRANCVDSHYGSPEIFCCFLVNVHWTRVRWLIFILCVVGATDDVAVRNIARIRPTAVSAVEWPCRRFSADSDVWKLSEELCAQACWVNVIRKDILHIIAATTTLEGTLVLCNTKQTQERVSAKTKAQLFLIT